MTERVIFGYKQFDNEDEFLHWQYEAPRQIYQMIPAPKSMSTKDPIQEGEQLNANINMGIFVVYAADTVSGD